MNYIQILLSSEKKNPDAKTSFKWEQAKKKIRILLCITRLKERKKFKEKAFFFLESNEWSFSIVYWSAQQFNVLQMFWIATLSQLAQKFVKYYGSCCQIHAEDMDKVSEIKSGRAVVLRVFWKRQKPCSAFNSWTSSSRTNRATSQRALPSSAKNMGSIQLEPVCLSQHLLNYGSLYFSFNHVRNWKTIKYAAIEKKSFFSVLSKGDIATFLHF